MIPAIDSFASPDSGVEYPDRITGYFRMEARPVRWTDSLAGHSPRLRSALEARGIRELCSRHVPNTDRYSTVSSGE